ncbi:Helix-turn-helix domain-containing protein [Tsukamurella pulmonis]|uniref:Helix-turn-helix domain-containing protein n=1 Tax=Tsukamurella pulmonis TaxID=47312 RepID=A0A1H1H6B1_9ACTN|nr:helix-turn-helix transcriptional regulator [Tsukamurella pulmonis]SDR20909.1 Helix-turn-helix domain-containing protein [Tsukamurella pulmonis]SUP15839.1 Predicted transcriptional regulator [Tsukamurella pulmonis]
MISDKLLGRYVRRRREELALTQEGLADLLGLKQFVVSRIEAGDRGLKVTELGKFAQALRTTPEALVTAATAPDPSQQTALAGGVRSTATDALVNYASAISELAAAFHEAPELASQQGLANFETALASLHGPTQYVALTATAANALRTELQALIDEIVVASVLPEGGTDAVDD